MGQHFKGNGSRDFRGLGCGFDKKTRQPSAARVKTRLPTRPQKSIPKSWHAKQLHFGTRGQAKILPAAQPFRVVILHFADNHFLTLGKRVERAKGAVSDHPSRVGMGWP